MLHCLAKAFVYKNHFNEQNLAVFVADTLVSGTPEIAPEKHSTVSIFLIWIF